MTEEVFPVLRILRGAKPGQVRLELPTTIGRGREAKLTLALPLVSRLHCEIYKDDGQVFIRDLGSTNGTGVEGQKID